MREFYFERMEVLQEARSFAGNIYRCSSFFPNEEKFGMISQIRKASISITANISEGMSRKTDKEKARFISIAFGSAWEVLNYLIIAKDFNWVEEDEYSNLREHLEKITNLLNGLHMKLKGADSLNR